MAECERGRTQIRCAGCFPSASKLNPPLPCKGDAELCFDWSVISVGLESAERAREFNRKLHRSEGQGEPMGNSLEHGAERVIYIVTTGGLIERTIDTGSDHTREVELNLHVYFRQLRLPGCDIRVMPLMQKDGPKMTDFDRRMISDMVGVLLRDNVPVVVTHSFEGILQTGLFLQKTLDPPSVPVILTGASEPYGKGRSDGLQNITVSLFAAVVLRPAVYVVLHNQALPLGGFVGTAMLNEFAPLDGNLNRRQE